MNKIIEDSKNIKLLKEGIQTAIIGKPNVGKSSLLNAMLKERKSDCHKYCWNNKRCR